MESKRNLILMTIISLLQFVNLYGQTSSTNVDSVFNLIKGNWYKTFNCGGFSGKCDSVYSSDLNQIERIAGTDSILWKTYQNTNLVSSFKYKLSYQQSYLYKANKWMLTNVGPKLIINVDANNFSYGIDAYDGGGTSYSRKPLVAGLENLSKDSSKLFFPNPTGSSFKVIGLDDVESINIFDMNGKLVQTVIPNHSNMIVDISGLTNGDYLVRIVSKNKVSVAKIVKK